MLENKNSKNLKEGRGTYSNEIFLDLALKLLKDLPTRAQEMIQKRFGFFNGKEETLEKIGKDYGVTRERVRQIIADANRKIIKKKNNFDFKKFESQIVFTINEKFGIIEKSELIRRITMDNKKEANALMFLCIYSDKIFKIEDEKIKESLCVEKDVVKRAITVCDIAKNILKKEARLLTDNEIVKKIDQKIKQRFSKEEILNYLAVSKEIRKNNFGKWGIYRISHS